MEQIKTRWSVSPEPYTQFDILIENDMVIFKEWWDFGRDPNRWEVSLEKFLGSTVENSIIHHTGKEVYKEVLMSVNSLLKNKKT